VISLYGATEAAYDGLTRRRGSYKAFRRGIAAAIEAGLPMRLNIVVTDVSADETTAMAALAAEWGRAAQHLHEHDADNLRRR
jgi:MoaA/NifB/PqqE/SkfB family radical SAM enzyme